MCLGVPAMVVEIVDPGRSTALVDMARVRRVVSTAVLDVEGDPVQVGDWVLVHTGFAVAKVDPAEARSTYELLGGGAPVPAGGPGSVWSPYSAGPAGSGPSISARGGTSYVA